jgi:branched-chain amino acid transport system ATP-binding protein
VMLELIGLTKFFGQFRAVHDLNLALRPGEIRAIIGPNGAGKSTVLHMIAGTSPLSAGDVKWHGKSIVGRPSHWIARAGIARSFQITSVFPDFTVFENVQIALLAGRGQCRSLVRPIRNLLRDEVVALLAQVRILEYTDRTVGELAAGDRKRVEFAIALAGQPRLMLLDEPTAGMSPEERSVVIDVIRDINQQRHVTVLFTEHDIDMVFAVAQNITVMNQGELLAEGTPSEVRRNSRVREVYLGQAN